MLRTLLLTATAAIAAAPLAAADGTLMSKAKAETMLQAVSFSPPSLFVGDAAPAFPVAGFAQGEPVTGFGDGRVYVIEMWATWCGPCIAAIPHISDLSEQYADDVTVIGTNIWENGPVMTDNEARLEMVKGFIADNPRMTYTVAYDNGSAVADSWMTPAGQNGIPAAFIVDREGVIAWVGHPMTMDDPLADIVSGEHDAAAARDAAIAEGRATQLLDQGVRALMGGDSKGYDMLEAAAIAGLERQPEFIAVVAATILSGQIVPEPNVEWAEALALHAWEVSGSTEPTAAYTAALAAHMQGNTEAATQRAGLILDAAGDDPVQLGSLAWQMATDENAGDAFSAVAVQLATRAADLTDHNDADILDTLARAHWVDGNTDKAIEIQTKAIDLADPRAKGDYEQRLNEYRSGDRG